MVPLWYHQAKIGDDPEPGYERHVPTAFAAILIQEIAHHFPSRRSFVRAAEPTANENSAAGYLSQVIAGKKPPPMDRVEAWADALDLKGRERDRFIDLACIAHLPTNVQGRFEALLRRVEACEERTTGSRLRRPSGR